MRWIFVGVAIGALWSGAPAAQSKSEPVALGERSTMRSTVLQQERQYLVYLPPSYAASPARRYPVIYLLDGIAHFNVTTGIVHHLSSASSAVRRIPESIVIALPNAGRTRDMTPTHRESGLYSENSGGAGNFVRFFREELFAEISSRYRATEERTLIGHSLAGLFTLHVFLDEPALFDHYIAIDPSLWWDDQVLTKRLSASSPRDHSKPASVFVAQANSPLSIYESAEQKADHEGAVRNFGRMLERKRWPQLRAKYEYFPDETHLSVPLIAIYRGLQFSYPEPVSP